MVISAGCNMEELDQTSPPAEVAPGLAQDLEDKLSEGLATRQFQRHSGSWVARPLAPPLGCAFTGLGSLRAGTAPGR